MKLVGNVKQTRAGFSLIELTLVLFLLMLLTFLSYPALTDLYYKHRLYAQVATTYEMLKKARLESLVQGAYITVCPNEDDQDCSKNWHNQIIAFVDLEQNAEINEQDRVLLKIPATNLLKVNRDRLQFAPIHSAGNTTATLTFCSKDQASRWRRGIVISNMGRIRMETEFSKLNCQR